jgi:hypothetical protein
MTVFRPRIEGKGKEKSRNFSLAKARAKIEDTCSM